LRLEAAVVVLATLSFAPAAFAQSRVALVVPEGTPRALVDALVVELQLSGYEPFVSRGVARGAMSEDLFAHSDASRAVVLDAAGVVIVADRDGPIAETQLDGPLPTRHPRLVAMVAADLAARERPPPPPPVVSLPRIRLADPTDALTAPAAAALSAQLEAPPEPSAEPDAADEEALAEEPPREPWPTWLRILTEVGFGFAGSAVLGVPAAIATDQAVGGWVYGYAIAGPIGFSLGVWLGGLLAGGDGNVFWTLLGGLVGGLVAGGLLLAGAAVDRDTTDGVDPGFTVVGGIALFALPTTLSVLGFELSGD